VYMVTMVTTYQAPHQPVHRNHGNGNDPIEHLTVSLYPVINLTIHQRCNDESNEKIQTWPPSYCTCIATQ